MANWKRSSNRGRFSSDWNGPESQVHFHQRKGRNSQKPSLKNNRRYKRRNNTRAPEQRRRWNNALVSWSCLLCGHRKANNAIVTPRSEPSSRVMHGGDKQYRSPRVPKSPKFEKPLNPLTALMLGSDIGDNIEGKPFSPHFDTNKADVSSRASLFPKSSKDVLNKHTALTQSPRIRGKAEMTDRIPIAEWQVFCFNNWVAYEPDISREVEKVFGYIRPGDADIIDDSYRLNWWRDEKNFDMFVYHYKHYRISPLLMLQRNMKSGNFKRIRRVVVPGSKLSYPSTMVMSSVLARRSRSRTLKQPRIQYNTQVTRSFGVPRNRRYSSQYEQNRLNSSDVNQWNQNEPMDRLQSFDTVTSGGTAMTGTTMSLNFEDYRLWNTAKVLIWLQKLKFPQYCDIFKKNHVTGMTLSLADLSYLTDTLGVGIEDASHMLSAIRVMKSGVIEVFGTQSFSSAGLFKEHLALSDVSLYEKPLTNDQVDGAGNDGQVGGSSESEISTHSEMDFPPEQRIRDNMSQDTSLASTERIPPPFNKFKMRSESQGKLGYRNTPQERNRHIRTFSTKPGLRTFSGVEQQRRSRNPRRRRQSAPAKHIFDNSTVEEDPHLGPTFFQRAVSLPEDQEIEPSWTILLGKSTGSSDPPPDDNVENQRFHQKYSSSMLPRSRMSMQRNPVPGRNLRNRHKRQKSSARRARPKWSSMSQINSVVDYRRRTTQTFSRGVQEAKPYEEENYNHDNNNDGSDDDDYEDDVYNIEGEERSAFVRHQRRETQESESNVQRYREIVAIEVQSSSEDDDDWQKQSTNGENEIRHRSEMVRRYSNGYIRNR